MSVPATIAPFVKAPRLRERASFIIDNLPIVRRKHEWKSNGHYTTERVIREFYDAMQTAIRTGQPYHTRLNPPPADPGVAHLARSHS